VAKLRPGRVVYAVWCDDRGKVPFEYPVVIAGHLPDMKCSRVTGRFSTFPSSKTCSKAMKTNEADGK
jgi:hypothetical protein